MGDIRVQLGFERSKARGEMAVRGAAVVRPEGPALGPGGRSSAQGPGAPGHKDHLY